jgi:hypothetical protein
MYECLCVFYRQEKGAEQPRSLREKQGMLVAAQELLHDPFSLQQGRTACGWQAEVVVQ